MKIRDVSKKLVKDTRGEQSQKCAAVLHRDVAEMRRIWNIFSPVSTAGIYRKWRTHQKAIFGRLRIAGAKPTCYPGISTCISFSRKSKAMQLPAITHPLFHPVSKMHFSLYIYVYACVYVSIYVCMYMCTYIYCARAHAHTHTHTHTHLCISIRLSHNSISYE